MKKLVMLLFLLFSSLQAKEWYINAWSDLKEISGEKPYKYSFENRSLRFYGNTIDDVINRGLAWNDPEYPVFIVYRESDDKTNVTTQTINKFAGDKSTFNVNNREINYVAENLDDDQNSFLVGNIETNFGLSGGMWVKKSVKRVGNKFYVMFMVSRINFYQTLTASAIEWCRKRDNKGSFRFIYDSTQMSSMLEKLNRGATIDKTGIISIPCSNVKDFGRVKLSFNSLSGWGNYIKIEELITENGFLLNLPHFNGTNTFYSSLNFFGSIMDRYNIDTGVIVRSNPMDIATHRWETGKCKKFGGGKKTFYVKKSLIQSSRVYTFEALPMVLPFEESKAVISTNDDTLKLSPYSPVSVIPSHKSTFMNITPDNHLQSFVLTEGVSLVENELKDKQYSVIANSTSKTKGCGFNLFAAIVTVVLIGLSIAFPGVATIVATPLALYTATLIWPGAGTPDIPGTPQTIKFSDYPSIMDAKKSGSSLYESFTNLRRSMSQISTTQSMITENKFKDVINKSQKYSLDTKINYNNENYYSLADYLIYNHGKDIVFDGFHFYQPYGAAIPFATRDSSAIYNGYDYANGITIGEVNFRNTIKSFILGQSTGDADVFNTKLVVSTLAKKMFPISLNEN